MKSEADKPSWLKIIINLAITFLVFYVAYVAIIYPNETEYRRNPEFFTITIEGYEITIEESFVDEKLDRRMIKFNSHPNPDGSIYSITGYGRRGHVVRVVYCVHKAEYTEFLGIQCLTSTRDEDSEIARSNVFGKPINSVNPISGDETLAVKETRRIFNAAVDAMENQP